MLIKVLIVVCLLGIIASLASGLFHLVNDKGQSHKMANALTVRVALSVALFVLLFIAWSQGLIRPHDINRPRNADQAATSPTPPASSPTDTATPPSDPNQADPK